MGHGGVELRVASVDDARAEKGVASLLTSSQQDSSLDSSKNSSRLESTAI